MTKTCRDCRKTKNIKKFPTNGKPKEGGRQYYRPNCSECYATEMRRKYRIDEKYRTRMKLYSRRQFMRQKAKQYGTA